MSDPLPDPRTPGRAAALGSSLGRADLVRRLARLSLGDEALPRVLRLVEDEVAAALATHSKDSYTTAEISAAGGDDDLVAKLKATREDERRVAAIRSASLADLSADDLQAVLAGARGERS
jgi:hypothetical protein